MNASDEISKEPRRGAAAPAERRANAGSSSSTARHFRLTGPSAKLDPRLNAFRDDLADIALSAQVLAPHYARPVSRAAASDTIVRGAPSDAGEEVTLLAAGEAFAVLEFAGGWAWGYIEANHLVGYVRSGDLGEPDLS